MATQFRIVKQTYRDKTERFFIEEKSDHYLNTSGEDYWQRNYNGGYENLKHAELHIESILNVTDPITEVVKIY